MTSPEKNRFVEEVEAASNSPHIDMDEVREYMRIIELFDSLQPEPPKQPEPPRLQPITPELQGMFGNT